MALRLEGLHDVTHLLLANIHLQRHEHAGLSHVPVVFWNFILQNQMISKRVPGQLCEEPLVLMSVLSVVSKDNVRRDLLLQLFEHRLYFGTYNRADTVGDGATPRVAARPG